MEQHHGETHAGEYARSEQATIVFHVFDRSNNVYHGVDLLLLANFLNKLDKMDNLDFLDILDN
ncbi:hypothetical protein [Segatella bryantii]|uniref:hypothetical protein n=1 Tax=Segatella bryantii TaxID=77095 RepID=UPI000944A0D5|nr:hypothetical protein [Segatella bryantii]